jgi:hypothetical protein
VRGQQQSSSRIIFQFYQKSVTALSLSCCCCCCCCCCKQQVAAVVCWLCRNTVTARCLHHALSPWTGRGSVWGTIEVSFVKSSTPGELILYFEQLVQSREQTVRPSHGLKVAFSSSGSANAAAVNENKVVAANKLSAVPGEPQNSSPQCLLGCQVARWNTEYKPTRLLTPQRCRSPPMDDDCTTDATLPAAQYVFFSKQMTKPCSMHGAILIWAAELWVPQGTAQSISRVRRTHSGVDLAWLSQLIERAAPKVG